MLQSFDETKAIQQAMLNGSKLGTEQGGGNGRVGFCMDPGF